MADHRFDTRRRTLLRAALAATAAPAATLSLAGAAQPDDARLLLFILRGGLDGLAAVPAVGDAAFAGARGALAQFAEPPLPLAGPFALHPALAGLHGLYGSGELAVLHAIGLPYRERSHFDAQQLLESGGARPFELATGWLGRALAGGRHKGMAFQPAVPLVLRGHADIDTWAPSALPEPTPDLVSRLERLYAGDAALSAALQRARELRAEGMPFGAGAAPMASNAGMAGTPGMAGMAGPASLAGGPRQGVVNLARQAAEFLARPGGPQVAVLEMGGWDSHANQQAVLANNLRTLDAALMQLREGLQAGNRWQRTVVLVVTEFGREVAANGTLGSDHGSGGAAFALGGAVRGGQVIADWPGLATKDRFEGRDLRITTDLRALFKTVLHQHLQLGQASIASQLLPGSAGLPLLPLLRG